MGLIKEFRSSLENPATPLSFPQEWLIDLWAGGKTDSGMRVSEVSSLQVVAVRACVEIIGRGVAMMPMFPYERTPAKHGRESRREAFEHPLYDLLSKCPNDEMNAVVFWSAVMACAALWANAYAEIQRDAAGRPVAFWPRTPEKTRPMRITDKAGVQVGNEFVAYNEMVYATTDGLEDTDTQGYRSQRLILPSDMLHIKGLSLNGRLGSSLVQDARQTIGLALALERYGAKFFGNGARSSYVIEVPGNITQEAKNQLSKSFQETLGGENMLRPLVLTSGMKATATKIDNNEAQFCDSRKMQDNQICAAFHIPPHMIGQMEKSNRSNLEQVSQEFVQYCLGPWLLQIKQEIETKCLPSVGRTANKYFVDCKPPLAVLLDLLRPSAADREKYYSTMYNVGAASPNDILSMEGKNPSSDDGMDDYYVGVNVQKVSDPVVTPQMAGPNPTAPGADKAPPADPKAGEPAPKPPAPEAKGLIRVHSSMFGDAFRRYSVRDSKDYAAFEKCFAPVLIAMADLVLMSADKTFHSGKLLPAGILKAVSDYSRATHKRWDKRGDAVIDCDQEFAKACRAITVEVYREVATAKALEILEVQES